MRLHKMNEENESTGISITKVYKMLTDGLRDYIIPSSDLADVLDDWEYTCVGETTINGEKGVINFDETYLFSYVNNTNLVIISSSDENIIGDFIIA